VDGIAVYGQMLVKLGGIGDITKETLKYRVGGMYIGTAAVAGDYLYTVNNVGVPSCYEWKTGKELWKDQIEGRPEKVADSWSSPVHADGRIYHLDQRGNTVIFAAGTKYEHLATNRLDEPSNSSIAISGGDIFIRTHKHLWCIGRK
jgi:outer membrane protein assembly factor BamB